MFPIFVAVLIAPKRAESASLPAPRGNGRLTVEVPKGFRVTNRQARLMLLQRGSAMVTITWSGNVVKPPLLRAMNSKTAALRKQGRVLGPVSVGPFHGVMLKLPITPHGLSLHSAMVSGSDLLSISYFNPAILPSQVAADVEMVKRLIASAKMTGP